jgi:hypothetical protein
VRWVDRGRGNILQARGDDLTIETLSNTILPYVYESAWSKDLKLFIGSILETDRETVSVVSTQLVPRATSTTGSQTPFELRGKNLPENTVAYVFSPKKDKIFLYVIENGRGVGYITNTSGSNTTQIFTTPITAVQVEWPEENTIAITTNGTASESGFLYFVSPKTGIWKKIMGPVTGLTTRTSHTAGFVVYSYTGARNDVLTGILSVASSTGNDAVVRTLADKCAWGNKYKELVYCAVPFQPVSGVYPDDWYRGSLSTVDKLWQINARTGEVHLISTLFTEAKQAIDAFNISLDDKDDFLYFMNKNNLSFWSYDLVVGSK